LDISFGGGAICVFGKFARAQFNHAEESHTLRLSRLARQSEKSLFISNVRRILSPFRESPPGQAKIQANKKKETGSDELNHDLMCSPSSGTAPLQKKFHLRLNRIVKWVN
jgi:hypothetical protein